MRKLITVCSLFVFINVVLADEDILEVVHFKEIRVGMETSKVVSSPFSSVGFDSKVVSLTNLDVPLLPEEKNPAVVNIEKSWRGVKEHPFKYHGKNLKLQVAIQKIQYNDPVLTLYWLQGAVLSSSEKFPTEAFAQIAQKQVFDVQMILTGKNQPTGDGLQIKPTLTLILQ